MTDGRPHAKTAYYMPLAYRLVDDRIRRWLRLCLAYADATAATEDIRQGVHHAGAHLDEPWVELVPDILDQLTRAGLLTSPGERRDGTGGERAGGEAAGPQA